LSLYNEEQGHTVEYEPNYILHFLQHSVLQAVVLVGHVGLLSITPIWARSCSSGPAL
jgi:hypothetical protein